MQNILDGSFDFMRWSILGNRELASMRSIEIYYYYYYYGININLMETFQMLKTLQGLKEYLKRRFFILKILWNEFINFYNSACLFVHKFSIFPFNLFALWK